MKRLNKLTTFALALLTVFSATGCKFNQTPADDGNNSAIPDTVYDLVKSGQSDYKILLSNQATDTEKYASGELVSFFEQATGVTLPIVTDATDVDKNGKYLSIGDTKLFEESGMDVSVSELGDDGFKIQTYGNSVVMNGAQEGGKLYAVYDFMEEQIGFETYAADEIYVDTFSDRKLKDFAVTEVPDFAGRDVHDIAYGNNATFAARKRLRGVTTAFSAAQGNGSVWSRTLWCHSTHILLRPSLHQTTHPEWFGDNGTDICYGLGIEDSENGELMRQTVFESLKYYIELQPNAKYFMIGLEDEARACGCSKCDTANKTYGGVNKRMSGTVVVFVNKIARMVKAWLQETYPERADKVVIAMFAYQDSEQPPVVKNQNTGEYTYHPDVVPDDNVMIRFAPIDATYSKPLTDSVANKTSVAVLDGWRALGANMSVWLYSCSFGNYLYPTYNWHVMQENYKSLLEYGVQDILDQGPRDTTLLPFQALRDYVQAELLWDVDQDINALIDEFIENYYKDAAPYIKEYFNLVNANYALMEKTQGYKWGAYPKTDKKYYPKQYLNQCLKLFEDAKKAIEKVEDASLRRTLMERVEKEEFSPRYILIENYKEYYDDATLRQMFTDFQADGSRLGLTYFKENQENKNNNGLITWRYDEWWSSLGN